MRTCRILIGISLYKARVFCVLYESTFASTRRDRVSNPEQKKKRTSSHPCFPRFCFRNAARPLCTNPSAMPITEYTPPTMAMSVVMKW